ncbi:MAG: phosphoglycerate kinase, partial [Rhodospirillales bacterium]
LPVDAVVAREFKEGAPSDVVDVRAMPKDAMMLDVGPVTVQDLTKRLKDCRTRVWYGPLGAFEIKPVDAGTSELARAPAKLTRDGTQISVEGGGDTVSALINEGVGAELCDVAAAGGAVLEWLEGKDLPGVAVRRT